MPIYALTIVVLALIVFYLIYRLNRASKEKIVVLITHPNEGLWKSWEEKTSWRIFDSMVEAKAFIKLQSKNRCKYIKIRVPGIILKSD